MRWQYAPLTIVLILTLLKPGARGAQEPPIRFRLGATSTEVRPGGEVVFTVSARIPRGWHLYGMRQPPGGPLPTAIEVGPAPPFALASAVTSSPPRSEFDPNFGLLVEWHDDSAAFRVPVRVARTALPAIYDAQVRISYQRCNDRICLPLTTDTLRAPVTVAGEPEPVQATSAPPPPEPAVLPAGGGSAGRVTVGLAESAAGSARAEPTDRAVAADSAAGSASAPARLSHAAYATIVARFLGFAGALVVLVVVIVLVRRGGRARGA
jgi:thiol:disulfide interchange protein DsbD